jgi:hypothetical protein
MKREKNVEIFEKHPEWNHLLIYGLNDASWVESLIEIESKSVYFKCIADYLEFYHAVNVQDMRTTIVIIFYFFMRTNQ